MKAYEFIEVLENGLTVLLMGAHELSEAIFIRNLLQDIKFMLGLILEDPLGWTYKTVLSLLVRPPSPPAPPETLIAIRKIVLFSMRTQSGCPLDTRRAGSVS